MIDKIKERELCPATIDDKAEIVALYRCAANEGRVNGSSDWDDEYPGEMFVDSDIEVGLYILKYEDEIISAISLVSHGDFEELDMGWTEGKSCVFARLCVSPKLQGKGIARYVMASMCKIAKQKGFTVLRFMSAKNNKASCHLYDSMGCTRLGETFMYNVDFYCYELVL